MPVVSKHQWKWMAVNRPDLLHKFQQESPVVYSRLPQRVSQRRPQHRQPRQPRRPSRRPLRRPLRRLGRGRSLR